MVTPAPNARAEFAQRLRKLRGDRGFKRARHLAEALGIDENRYTRYERAETEPDITLLSLICQKLGVTPNQLLGYAESDRHEVGPAYVSPQAPAGALHEPLQPPLQPAPDPPASPHGSQESLRRLLWRLAEWSAQHPSSGGAPPPAGLGRVEKIAQLYTAYLADPFAAVGRVAGEASRVDASPASAREVEMLIEEILTELRFGHA